MGSPPRPFKNFFFQKSYHQRKNFYSISPKKIRKNNDAGNGGKNIFLKTPGQKILEITIIFSTNKNKPELKRKRNNLGKENFKEKKNFSAQSKIPPRGGRAKRKLLKKVFRPLKTISSIGAPNYY